MVRKSIREKIETKMVAALLATVIAFGSVQNVHAVVQDNVDSVSTDVGTSTEIPNGNAGPDQILKGYGAWANGELVIGTIETLDGTNADHIKSVQTTETEKAGRFNYKVSSIGQYGQTITISKEKYTGADDFTVYIPSIPDLMKNTGGDQPSYAPLKDNVTVTPGTKQQVIEPGDDYIGLKSVTVEGDAELKSENILEGVTIFDVAGSIKKQSASNTTLAYKGSKTYKAGYYPNDWTVTGGKPSGTKTISSNGTYDITDFSSVSVSVNSSPKQYFEDANYMIMLGNDNTNNVMNISSEKNLYVEYRARLAGKHLEIYYYDSSNTLLDNITLESNSNYQCITTLSIPSGTCKITSTSDFSNANMATCALLIAY